jgi:hypothetical protein
MRLNLTSEALSVAEYSLTGMETRPKDNDSDAIERAGMCFSSQASTVRRLGMAGSPMPAGFR